MSLLPEDLIKLLLALLVGGLIGAEREFRDKAAGFRTLIFICLGAALFTIFSAKIGGPDDATRIAANIVSGVGFLGAGVIMRDTGRVVGLTTAAMIWLTAALGMGIGGGYYALSLGAAGLVLLVLLVFPTLEGAIDNAREQRTYEIVCAVNLDKVEQIRTLLREYGLRVRQERQAKVGGETHCAWDTVGKPQNHERLVKQLTADPDIREYRF